MCDFFCLRISIDRKKEKGKIGLFLVLCDAKKKSDCLFMRLGLDFDCRFFFIKKEFPP
jgi:hypothetical protein